MKLPYDFVKPVIVAVSCKLLRDLSVLVVLSALPAA